MISFVIAISCLSLVFAVFLARYVIRRDAGTAQMQEISNAIKEGAEAFLSRQNRTIISLSAVLAALIFVLYAFVRTPSPADPVPPVQLAFWTTLSFILGAACSVIAGYIGMWVSIRSNIRTASAVRSSLNDGLQIALRGGAVSGLFVVAMSLLGVGGLYALLEALGHDPQKIPFTIVGYGFGASFVALFAQLGGGIYTKAADVGADLVGKVEAGIPEDDPRNPAVIADLVGDNVGDCAGRGADIFESTAAENIGAMILGASVALVLAHNVMENANPAWVIFPLVVVGLGIICSLLGTLVVRKSQAMEPANARGRDPGDIAMGKMNQGYYVTSALSAISIFVAAGLLLGSATDHWWVLGLCGLVGIVTSFAFVFLTQYYTAGSFRPVREIAEASKTGPATNIIAGLAVGFENTGLFVLVICGAIGLAYYLGSLIPGLPHVAGGLISVGGIYGTAVATMGMLMSAGFVLAMDSFGPITDNAGGIVEMSGAPDSVRNITDALDGVGNTTKALTKGYGIGSAALAAFLLFSAYLDILAQHQGDKAYFVNLANPPIFIAALIGAMLIFLFSSLAIRAVGRAAQGMIEEVRRQFRADPGIMEGTSKPDYARCVSISTGAALREMVVPGILVVGTPILVGVILGPLPAAGLLMVGTVTGIMMALVMNNGGGAWDNAKKYIEAGNLKDDKGNVLGKRSPAHEAAVVGDTVGDPFKDTAGPSLHIVIKLLSTITLVLAPLFIALHK